MNSGDLIGEQMSFIEPRENKQTFLFKSGVRLHLASGGRGELIDPISAVRLDTEYHNLSGWEAISGGSMMSGDKELTISVGDHFGARLSDAIKK